jgi:hypothetical protein
MSTTPTALDLQNMPLEELKRLAEAEAAAPVAVDPPAPVTEQPRGPDGKFIAQNPPKEEVSSPELPVVFQRIIDLGDGSGVQVFQADTAEALIDKLAEAQTHATRKIRELNKAQKEVPAPVVEISNLSPDEEYVLAQTLMTNPSKVIRAEIERQFGMPVEEVKKSLAEHKQDSTSRRNDATAKAWADATPDYYADDANGRKMVAYINKFHGGQATTENLTAAFQDLNSSGLLKAKPAPVEPVVPAPAAPAPPARRSSGISSLPNVPPPVSTEPSLDELYAMPLEKLEALARGRAVRGL